jgi:hypothetical protein
MLGSREVFGADAPGDRVREVEPSLTVCCSAAPVTLLGSPPRSSPTTMASGWYCGLPRPQCPTTRTVQWRLAEMAR